MEIIGLDLHKRESQLSIKAETARSATARSRRTVSASPQCSMRDRGREFCSRIARTTEARGTANAEKHLRGLTRAAASQKEIQSRYGKARARSEDGCAGGGGRVARRQAVVRSGPAPRPSSRHRSGTKRSRYRTTGLGARCYRATKLPHCPTPNRGFQPWCRLRARTRGLEIRRTPSTFLAELESL